MKNLLTSVAVVAAMASPAFAWDNSSNIAQLEAEKNEWSVGINAAQAQIDIAKERKNYINAWNNYVQASTNHFNYLIGEFNDEAEFALDGDNEKYERRAAWNRARSIHKAMNIIHKAWEVNSHICGSVLDAQGYDDIHDNNASANFTIDYVKHNIFTDSHWDLHHNNHHNYDDRWELGLQAPVYNGVMNGQGWGPCEGTGDLDWNMGNRSAEIKGFAAEIAAIDARIAFLSNKHDTLSGDLVNTVLNALNLLNNLEEQYKNEDISDAHRAGLIQNIDIVRDAIDEVLESYTTHQ